MRILVISNECASIDLAYRLVKEGNEVKYFVKEKGYKEVGKGFGIKKITNWGKELQWVDNKGLILFDYTGFGEIQDELRKKGYSVVGGSKGGDRLELDRGYATKIFKQYAMNTLPLYHFNTIKAAVQFIEKNKKAWVIKHNGYVDKLLTYVGKMPDGRDVIDQLINYDQYNKAECHSIALQEKVSGVEIGTGRFFNGREWVGPIEIFLEHKKLFPQDLGPMTGEMGTLLWYDVNENNRLFNETLAKLKPHLIRINFRGSIDINCIVNEQGAFPLEATARFGYPALELQTVLLRSPVGELLKTIADGRNHNTRWYSDYGIVVQVAIPPFPYTAINGKYNPKGLKVYFNDELTDDELKHVHFSEVAICQNSNGKKEHVIASIGGYVMCVTGIGKTVQLAREKTYNLIDKVIVPKMFYRNDIGVKFIENDKALLKKWGYL